MPPPNALYFKLNVFDVRIHPLRVVHIGCSGWYKIGEKTPDEALKEVIVPPSGVTQVVYFDKDFNKIELEQE